MLRLFETLFPLIFLVVACSAETHTNDAASSATATAGTTAKPAIPGLMPVDIYLNLESEEGHECGGPSLSDEGLSWVCTKQTPGAAFQVLIVGNSATDVVLIDASVFMAPEEQAKAFLGHIASIEYQGGNPREARAWVMSSMEAGGERTLGSAKFTISGHAGARFLHVAAVGLSSSSQ
jgi:hypothetical protein